MFSSSLFSVGSGVELAFLSARFSLGSRSKKHIPMYDIPRARPAARRESEIENLE